MGVDVYAEWRGQNWNWNERMLEEPELIWSTTSGHLGYLREAVSRGPFVTPTLLREAFAAKSQRAKIPAAVMRERLPEAMATVLEQIRTYRPAGETDPMVKTFADFVDLCERMEAATGEPCSIYVSY
jgi:hypothetical protein